MNSFQSLKERLIDASIMRRSDLTLSFEVMCDASDSVVGVVLRKRHDKHFHPIHCASKMLTLAQENYTTTEKELLDIICAFDKFRPYLVQSKLVAYIVSGGSFSIVISSSNSTQS